MSDDQTLALVCGGFLLLALVALAAVFISGMGSFTVRKERRGENAILTITARKNLNRITVLARFDGEEVKFERRRVRKGQSVDFSFPYSDKKTKVIVEAESGSARVLEA